MEEKDEGGEVRILEGASNSGTHSERERRRVRSISRSQQAYRRLDLFSLSLCVRCDSKSYKMSGAVNLHFEYTQNSLLQTDDTFCLQLDEHHTSHFFQLLLFFIID